MIYITVDDVIMEIFDAYEDIFDLINWSVELYLNEYYKQT